MRYNHKVMENSDEERDDSEPLSKEVDPLND